MHAGQTVLLDHSFLGDGKPRKEWSRFHWHHIVLWQFLSGSFAFIKLPQCLKKKITIVQVTAKKAFVTDILVLSHVVPHFCLKGGFWPFSWFLSLNFLCGFWCVIRNTSLIHLGLLRDLSLPYRPKSIWWATSLHKCYKKGFSPPSPRKGFFLQGASDLQLLCCFYPLVFAMGASFLSFVISIVFFIGRVFLITKFFLHLSTSHS